MENDELKHLAPVLFSLRNSGLGFVVPSNYFAGIENRFFFNEIIDKTNSKSGFAIPENYFDNVESQVILKTTYANKKDKIFNTPEDYFNTIESNVLSKLEKKKNTSIFHLQKFWISASIAAMVLLTFGIYNYQKKTTEFSLAEMENWIDNGTVNLNTYEIASLYDTEFEQIELSDFIKDEELEEYLQNDFNEYLYDE